MKASTQRLIALGAVAAALLVSSSAKGGVPSHFGERIDAATVRQIAQPVANLIGQPGLPDMLAAVAYTESRFRTRIKNSSGMMGIFQLAPGSMRLSDAHLPSSVLYDPRFSTALLAWYYKRLQPYARTGQTIDWLALRRGSAYPALVADTDESEKRSRDVRERFEDALAATGTDESFMYRAAFPSGYHWPGLDAVLATLGIGREIA